MPKLFALLLSVVMLNACSNSPMPFSKNKWLTNEGGEHYLVNKDRYRMMLWLEKNYTFCGKHLDEIMEEFGIEHGEIIPGSRRKEIIKYKKLEMVTRQRKAKKLIDPPFATDWIKLYFNDELYVSRATFVNADREKEYTERIICE